MFSFKVLYVRFMWTWWQKVIMKLAKREYIIQMLTGCRICFYRNPRWNHTLALERAFQMFVCVCVVFFLFFLVAVIGKAEMSGNVSLSVVMSLWNHSVKGNERSWFHILSVKLFTSMMRTHCSQAQTEKKLPRKSKTANHFPDIVVVSQLDFFLVVVIIAWFCLIRNGLMECSLTACPYCPWDKPSPCLPLLECRMFVLSTEGPSTLNSNWPTWK